MVKKLFIAISFFIFFGLSYLMMQFFMQQSINNAPSQEQTSLPNLPAIDETRSIIYDDNITQRLGKLNGFSQTSGRWALQDQLIFTTEAIGYQDLDDQVSIELTKPTLSYDDRNDQFNIHDAFIPKLQISTPIPFTDYNQGQTSDDDVIFDGTINIGECHVKLTHPLNQAHTLMEFSFTPKPITVSAASFNQLMQEVMKQTYAAMNKELQTGDPEMLKKWIENTLAFALGWPVYIENAEGSIDEGKLIFEDIYIGEKQAPIVYIPQAVAEASWLSLGDTKGQIIVKKLSLFEPQISEAFSKKATAQEGNLWGNLNFIYLRLLQLIEEKPAKEHPYNIITSFDEVTVGDGTVKIIRSDNNDFSVYQGRIFGFSWLGAPHRLEKPEISETLGLLASMVENFSKAARLLYDQADNQNNNQNQ